MAAITLTVDNTAFTIMSRNGKPMEDIPGETESLIERKTGIKTIVIDAHNSISPTASPPSDWHTDKIKDKATQAVLETLCKTGERYSEIYIGISTATPRNIQGLEDGGIAATWLEIGGTPLFLICFDGNNMVEGLRNKILKAAQSRYPQALGEILTTDNHASSGLLPGIKYKPVGYQTDEEQIVKTCLTLLENAEKTKKPVKPYIVKTNHEVVVLGENIQKISNFVKESLKTLKLGIIMIAAIHLAWLATII